MKNGFSLIEALVAITLFALLSVVASGIFVNVNGLQQHTASLERLQNDGRYILEKLAREIRGRRLDFQNLALDENNETSALAFKPDEQDISVAVALVEEDLLYSVNGQTAPLNAGDVAVAEAKFAVQPRDDPETDFVSGIQPRVTILLKLTNRQVAPKYQKELVLQTTISSRFYQR